MRQKLPGNQTFPPQHQARNPPEPSLSHRNPVPPLPESRARGLPSSRGVQR